MPNVRRISGMARRVEHLAVDRERGEPAAAPRGRAARCRRTCVSLCASAHLACSHGQHQPRVGDGLRLEVPAGRAQHLLGHHVGQRAVDVVAAQVGIAAVPEHAERKARAVDDREVERAAAEVVDRRVAQAGALQVGDGGGDRLLDQAQVGEARAAGWLASVALRARSRNADGTVTTVGSLGRVEAARACTGARRSAPRPRPA